MDASNVMKNEARMRGAPAGEMRRARQQIFALANCDRKQDIT
jgi:hypothetical protein